MAKFTEQKQTSLWSSRRWKTSLFAHWLAEVETGLDCLRKLTTAFISLMTGQHKEIIRTGTAGNLMTVEEARIVRRYWGIAMERALLLQRKNYSSLPEFILSGQNGSRVSLKSHSHVRRSFRRCMRHTLQHWGSSRATCFAFDGHMTPKTCHWLILHM